MGFFKMLLHWNIQYNRTGTLKKQKHTVRQQLAYHLYVFYECLTASQLQQIHRVRIIKCKMTVTTVCLAESSMLSTITNLVAR